MWSSGNREPAPVAAGGGDMLDGGTAPSPAAPGGAGARGSGPPADTTATHQE